MAANYSSDPAQTKANLMSPTVNFTYSAKLERVIDGDTAVLSIDLGFNVCTTQHVRMLGYNAPEMHKSHAADGVRARAELEMLLSGKSLIVTTTREFSQTFARYLADVFVVTSSGTESVSEHMIQAGFDVPKGG